MISDLDESIKQLLIKEGKLEPAEVDIVFDMPDREWSAAISKPTVNLYLYDIHENQELRDLNWTITRDNGVATKRKSPVRIDLSYLITVWTNDTADQHRLLSHILTTLIRFPELPEGFLQGRLAALHWPLKATTAQPDGVLRNSADFWGALDNQLKPSISYVVTIPVEQDVEFSAPEVKTKVFTYGSREGGGSSDQLVQISGVVRRQGKPDEVVADAVVSARDLQMTATTDENGMFAFRRMKFGSHTFEVAAPGEKKKEVPVEVPSINYDIEL
jgi:hypothetical protein